MDRWPEVQNEHKQKSKKAEEGPGTWGYQHLETLVFSPDCTLWSEGFPKSGNDQSDCSIPRVHVIFHMAYND